MIILYLYLYHDSIHSMIQSFIGFVSNYFINIKTGIKYLLYVMLDSYHKIIAIGCNNIIYYFSSLKLRFIQKGRNK